MRGAGVCSSGAQSLAASEVSLLKPRTRQGVKPAWPDPAGDEKVSFDARSPLAFCKSSTDSCQNPGVPPPRSLSSAGLPSSSCSGFPGT